MNRVYRMCPLCDQLYAAGGYGQHRRDHTPLRKSRAGAAVPRDAKCALIVAAIRAGREGADVGREFHLTRERVRQIWTRETGTGLPRLGPTPYPCPTCSELRFRDERHARTDVHRATVQAQRIAHFWEQVNREGPVPPFAPRLGPCWIWQGPTHTQNGYGSAHLVGQGYAHRVSHVLTKGPIPRGLTIDHLCRVVACVNPGHLEAVTHRENIMRSPIAPAALNAAKTHCKRGHEFSAENTALRNGGRARVCRACRRARVRRRAEPQTLVA